MIRFWEGGWLNADFRRARYEEVQKKLNPLLHELKKVGGSEPHKLVSLSRSDVETLVFAVDDAQRGIVRDQELASLTEKSIRAFCAILDGKGTAALREAASIMGWIGKNGKRRSKIYPRNLGEQYVLLTTEKDIADVITIGGYLAEELGGEEDLHDIANCPLSPIDAVWELARVYKVTRAALLQELWRRRRMYKKLVEEFNADPKGLPDLSSLPQQRQLEAAENLK